MTLPYSTLPLISGREGLRRLRPPHSPNQFAPPHPPTLPPPSPPARAQRPPIPTPAGARGPFTLNLRPLINALINALHPPPSVSPKVWLVFEAHIFFVLWLAFAAPPRLYARTFVPYQAVMRLLYVALVR